MMRLGSHEAHELNELLLSCTNSIQSMALFINQAQDPDLRYMIVHHYSVHVQDYNMKMEYANQMISRDLLNIPKLSMEPVMETPTAQYPGMQPKVKLQQLDDRAIATSYLLTLNSITQRSYTANATLLTTVNCVYAALTVLFLIDTKA